MKSFLERTYVIAIKKSPPFYVVISSFNSTQLHIFLKKKVTWNIYFAPQQLEKQGNGSVSFQGGLKAVLLMDTTSTEYSQVVGEWYRGLGRGHWTHSRMSVTQNGNGGRKRLSWTLQNKCMAFGCVFFFSSQAHISLFSFHNYSSWVTLGKHVPGNRSPFFLCKIFHTMLCTLLIDMNRCY